MKKYVPLLVLVACSNGPDQPADGGTDAGGPIVELRADTNRNGTIDWEYGAFGTAMFDLANLSANGAFGATEDAALLDAYFEGRVTDDLRRSFHAMKAGSALREALWAMVSDVHLKTPGIDYAAHAREYLRRFEQLLSS